MIYENEETRRIEDQIAAAYARMVGCRWSRNPVLHVVPDHCFVMSGGFVYAETKRRYFNFRGYDDWYIDLSKVEKLQLKSPERSMFLIGFNDFYGIIKLKDHGPYKESIGGRRDRQDRNDIDKLAHFRWSDFVVLGQRESNYE